jgi:signal peptidase II
MLATIVFVVLAADQVTKTLVVTNMDLFESLQPVPALVPFFQITRSFNTGSAFGFMADMPFAGNLFLVIAVVVSGVLLWTFPRIPEDQPLARFATPLIIGGALGNAIDRVIYGHVIDFIHYQIPGIISNVSNLADHAIVVGVALMIWSSWRGDHEPEPDDT